MRQSSAKSYRDYHRAGHRGRFKAPRRRRVMARASSITWQGNPFAKSAPLNLTRSITILLPFLLGAWIGTMLLLPYFRISQTRFQGLRIIERNEIGPLVDSYLSSPWRLWGNFFLIKPQALKTYLAERLPVQSITVAKEFPQTLSIAVEEKHLAVIYDDGSRYALLDENGSLIKDLGAVAPAEVILNVTSSFQSVSALNSSTATPQLASSTVQTVRIPDFKQLKEKYGDYPVITASMTSATSTVENHHPSGETTRGIISAVAGIEKNKLSRVHYIELAEAGSGVIIHTDKPWKILLQPKNDILAQVNNLQLVLKKELPKEYLDVRFGERVFWK